MHKKFYLLYYWFPPLLWMSTIFYMSSQKSVSITSGAVSEFVTFKTLHMVEYAFLFFLFYRAFHSLKFSPIDLSVLYAFVIAILYSVTDELHQLSVPTRQGRLRDIFFDIVGMIVMYGIIKKVPLIKKLL